MARVRQSSQDHDDGGVTKSTKATKTTKKVTKRTSESYVFFFVIFVIFVTLSSFVILTYTPTAHPSNHSISALFNAPASSVLDA